MTQSLLTVTSNHSFPLPEIEAFEGYHAIYENRFGEQMVLLINRETLEGEIFHGDAEWQRRPVSRDKPFPNMILSMPERLWIASCWMALLDSKGEDSNDILVSALSHSAVS